MVVDEWLNGPVPSIFFREFDSQPWPNFKVIIYKIKFSCVEFPSERGLAEFSPHHLSTSSVTKV